MFMLCPRCPCQCFHNKVKGGLKRRFPVRGLQQENQPRTYEISIIQHSGPPFRDPSGCSGSPGWAVRGQCSTPAFRPPGRPLPGSAPWALAEAGCSAWAPKLGLGQPPGAESPTFSRQEGGRRRAFPVVHWQQQRRHRSQLLRRGQSSEAGRAQGGGGGGGAQANRAPRLPLHPCVRGLCSKARSLDALPSSRVHLPQKETLIFRPPRNTFLAQSWKQFPWYDSPLGIIFKASKAETT